MNLTRPKYRIFKWGGGIWADIGRPWMFYCRACGRHSHWESQQDAIANAELHDCAPGSPW